jgi:hypothetical protein
MKTMKKNITKKYIGALLASIVLITYPAVLSRAQTTNTITNQNTVWNETTLSEISEKQIRNTSHLPKDYTQLKEIILLKVKELTKQNINLEIIQTEIQNMLNSDTDIQKRGQNSTSSRGFYETGIFSCRGFA